MRAKLTLLLSLVVGTLGGVLATGCQTYDFEPVEPLAVSQTTVETRVEAKALKPNLMLLVDTSGSMTLPLNPALPACKLSSGSTCGGDAPCPTTCPTRWRALQGAMNTFLTQNGRIARMGLATYPGKQLVQGTVCGGTTALREALPTEEDDNTLIAKAAAVNKALQDIPNSAAGKPEGGTPTSTSLNYLGTLPDMQVEGREDLVLLLTDGLPNCNENNENFWTKATPDRCRCTLENTSFCESTPYDKLGCLDKDGSVTAVRNLRNKQIRTIVIGFGAETATGNGTEVLNAMAEAGGFALEAKACTADADCGAGDTCDTTAKTCRRRFYQAGNQTELSAALEAISKVVGPANPCLLQIPPDQLPSSENLVVVYINKERVEAGENTWRLNLPSEGVEFKGDLCTRIKNSTAIDPVDIEVRAVQRR
ncbi:adventurous gliding motility lipoprotein CglB [Archangium sp.]|jgi:hypothetical protein|uniref:adventurous gliding motility lipoprotein CglB n=1 Tax=Archangium sp. TaxID=1872627 RepID=UPI002EDB6AE9